MKLSNKIVYSAVVALSTLVLTVAGSSVSQAKADTNNQATTTQVNNNSQNAGASSKLTSTDPDQIKADDSDYEIDGSNVVNGSGKDVSGYTVKNGHAYDNYGNQIDIPTINNQGDVTEDANGQDMLGLHIVNGKIYNSDNQLMHGYSIVDGQYVDDQTGLPIHFNKSTSTNNSNNSDQSSNTTNNDASDNDNNAAKSSTTKAGKKAAAALPSSKATSFDNTVKSMSNDGAVAGKTANNSGAVKAAKQANNGNGNTIGNSSKTNLAANKANAAAKNNDPSNGTNLPQTGKKNSDALATVGVVLAAGAIALLDLLRKNSLIAKLVKHN